VITRIIIRAIAENDIAKARRWYERQRVGLGGEFIAEVRAALERLQADSDLGIDVFEHMRRYSVRRFPYGVFYIVEADSIRVLAVLHARRSPRAWKRRLR
jgi:plasmid stabilization system protein ParE